MGCHIINSRVWQRTVKNKLRVLLLTTLFANTLMRPDSLSADDMLTRMANQVRVSQAGLYVRQSFQDSTPARVCVGNESKSRRCLGKHVLCSQ